MKKSVLSLLVLCFVISESRTETPTDPDLLRNVSELISDKGYPVQDHTVQTSDGYLLSMQRIPHGMKVRCRRKRRPAALLLHGFLTSSSLWVLNSPDQSLGFILADKGYDVWLGNSRGNIYSDKHVNYSTKNPKFWDFSFDEMALYDLPAMIDYILNLTEEEKLFFVGYSQGTQIGFALLSEKTEYNDKISLFVALAPVATVGCIVSPIRNYTNLLTNVANTLKLMGHHDFMTLRSTGFKKFASKMTDRILGKNAIFYLFDLDRAQLNESRLDVYAQSIAQGTSMKNAIHLIQLIDSKQFTKFDYKSRNMDVYHQETPPEYDLTLITTPVALFWAKEDKLGDPQDVSILRATLKSVVFNYCVPYPPFNHNDFVIALDANKLVYEPILSLLKRYDHVT